MEVVVIRAIPKKLLIHSATLYHVDGEDRWGRENHDDEIELTKIRMEPSGKVVRDKNNAEIQLAAILFYDCKNSIPKNISFANGDVIVFNGQKHKIQMIEPLYDESRLHHYELGLVRHG